MPRRAAALVGHRPLEQQAMVAEPVAVVGRIDDQRVLARGRVVAAPSGCGRRCGRSARSCRSSSRSARAAARRSGPACATCLARNSRSFGSASFGVPSRLARCHHGRRSRSSVRCARQVDLVGMVHVAPGRRRIEGMVRIGEGRPDAEGPVACVRAGSRWCGRRSRWSCARPAAARNARSAARPSRRRQASSRRACSFARRGRRRGTSARSAGRSGGFIGGNMLWPSSISSTCWKPM